MRNTKLREIQVPKLLTILYWVIVCVGAVAAYMFIGQVLALTILAMGFCGFVFLDLIFDIKKNPPQKALKRVHAVLCFIFVGLAFALLIFVIDQYAI